MGKFRKLMIYNITFMVNKKDTDSIKFNLVDLIGFFSNLINQIKLDLNIVKSITIYLYLSSDQLFYIIFLVYTRVWSESWKDWSFAEGIQVLNGHGCAWGNVKDTPITYWNM
jgi:hypothetical protein